MTLYPSRTRQIKFLVAAVLLLALGAWLVVKKGELMAWLLFAAFGVNVIVSVIAMRPGANVLTLDKDGFRATSLFRVRHVLWRNATNFHVGSLSSLGPESAKYVRYNDSGRKDARLGTRVNAMWGYNSILGDTYGMSAEDLAQLMTRWRNWAAGAETSSRP